MTLDTYELSRPSLRSSSLNIGMLIELLRKNQFKLVASIYLFNLAKKSIITV